MYTGNYRHPYLDYMAPGIFMITFMKRTAIPLFSYPSLNEYFREPYRKVSARYYNIGHSLRRSLLQFQDKFPSIGIIQHSIMPDHIHFILQIKERLEEHLGRYMGRMKALMLQNAIKEGLISANTNSLFETGFNDQYLSSKRSLQVLINYVRENPYRLWIRKKSPEFFQRKENFLLAGEGCRIYGHETLLSNPFKYAVVNHSAFSREELEKRMAIWRYAIMNGGVLVGAFVNPVEKEIYKEVLLTGGKMIKFDEVEESERWKPQGAEFKMCESGRLLLVKPYNQEPLKRYRKDPDRISRVECKYLNNIAEKIEREGV